MSVTAASPEVSPGGDEAVLEVYDRAASRYDLVNDLVSFGTSNWYRRRTILSLELPEDATLVDVGTGTGSLAVAAQRFLPDSPAIVAVDPSTEMRGLAVKAGVRDVRTGPFGSALVDERSVVGVGSGCALR
ncbi:MAG: class I SAM-dependent methyltransferase [Phycisphaeraceae bacterium]|nr:class I SAM-dependent methyltransferase [Phycisphaeraceae bacterium]